MSFTISKIFWLIAEPTDLATILFLLAAILLWTRRRGIARIILTLMALTTAAVAVLPVADWLMDGLESRFPVPDLPPKLDGIILLGGFLDQDATRWRGEPTVNADATRLITFLALARRYPEAKLVFTGGSGILREGEPSEASVVRQILAAIGFDQARMIYEDRSRTTWENALFTKRMIDPQAGQRWLLVSSAYQLPRAVGCFRAVGWEGIIPYPTDFKGDQATLFTAGQPMRRYLAELSVALHEWIGLVAYRLHGRTDSLFPAPR